MNEPHQGEYVSMTPYIAMRGDSEDFWRISKVSVNSTDSSLIFTFIQKTDISVSLWQVEKILRNMVEMDISANLLHKAKTDILLNLPNEGRSNFLD